MEIAYAFCFLNDKCCMCDSEGCSGWKTSKSFLVYDAISVYVFIYLKLILLKVRSHFDICFHILKSP